MTAVPRVSVLLAVYNGGELLERSLRSILGQSWRDFEFLVVDDGSTDCTPDLLRACRDPRLRVLTNASNIGLTRSLNRGLHEARGQWIARQDADDLSAPRRLEAQMAFLAENPSVQLLGTSCWRLTPAGRISGSNDLPATHDALRWASLVDNPFLHTSVLFRRSLALEELGGYDEHFSVCQDFELWNRIAARHPVANLPARLVFMREHPASMTRTASGRTSTEMNRLFAKNRAALFPGRVFSAEEVRLLDLFRERFAASELPALRAVLERLLGEFLEAHPRARGSADLSATLCRQSLRLAYKFLGSERRAALGEIARAFRINPREWLRQGAAATIGALGAMQ